MEEIRLQKYIADCGVCSRRSAEKLIEDGEVTVDDAPAHLGQKIDPAVQKVKIHHKLIRMHRKEFTYIMMYKPRGYVTTAADEMGRKCVMDIVRSVSDRIYPVGRLDKDSEGLLLMTNDGDLANKLTHPKNHIGKTYRTIVEGTVDRKQLSQLADGVRLEDDYVTKPAEVEILRVKDDRTILSITIFEGKNRQIRRMCEAVGLNVLRLKREKLGKLSIGTLRSGQYRKLLPDEVEYLKSL